MHMEKIIIKGIEHVIKYEKNQWSNIYTLYKNNNFIGVIETPTEYNEYWKTKQDISRVSYLNIFDGYKNNGYGTFLINYITHILKNKNCTIMSVASSTSAIPFYLKNGFKKYDGIENIFTRYRYNLNTHLYYKFIK